MIAVTWAVRWLVPGNVWQLLLGGTLAMVAYAAVVYPLRHEALGILRRAAP
jgi:PST family polysaccharide transporter